MIPRLVDPTRRALADRVQSDRNRDRAALVDDPNLQNIPVRGELGRRIRSALSRATTTPLARGRLQPIELRLMAHLSGDEAMRARSQIRTISTISPRARSSAHRRTRGGPQPAADGQSVNFGLFYGMSDFGLAQRLEISRAEAKEITTAYFARFPQVRAYIERTLEEVGPATATWRRFCGRRRYMPGLMSGNYMLRAAAEREATNAPLQGSAADLMKLAMVRVERALETAGLDATMLLQIHDELIFEVRRADVAATAQLVRTHMETALELRVPLEVTIKTGRNWYDVEPMTEESLERV